MVHPKDSLPSFIYGTAWKLDRTKALTLQAIEAGFRAIDTANQPKHYQEALVGEALLASYQRGFKREDFFLQTKFTPLDGHDERIPYDPKAPISQQIQESLESSLEHLHTDYLDAYLLHGPYHYPNLGAEDFEAWKKLEEIAHSGKVKAIGISNVNAQQLETLLSHAKVKPRFVQNRCYAQRGWDQSLREICKRSGISYQGFSLLTANAFLFQDERLLEISRKRSLTPAQIIFRFSMALEMVPLTGSSSLKHLQEDLAVLNLTLNEEEIKMLERVASHSQL